MKISRACQDNLTRKEQRKEGEEGADKRSVGRTKSISGEEFSFAAPYDKQKTK